MRLSSQYKITKFSIFIPLAFLSSTAFASDFNLPFINAADLGNVYSGWAAEAGDASTAYTNPAGLIKIQNQQLVLAVIGVSGSTQFKGTATTPASTESGTASSKLRGILPSFYYAAPINNSIVFGFGETVPFALGTNYPADSVVRYAATRSQIFDLDIGPSVGFKINDKLSAGFGLDANRLALTLNGVYGSPLTSSDAEGQNTFTGWGYGWHGGLLYQFTPATRVGLSYNSHVIVRATGASAVFGPTITNGALRVTNQETNYTLPARTQLSAYHDFNQRWTIMGTIFYTNWGVLNQVNLRNTMLPSDATSLVTIPLNYHNTFDYAAGVKFAATKRWSFSSGIQLLQTPSNNRDRSVVDPSGNMTIVGIGAHYQQNKNLSYDIGYDHAFFHETAINLVSPLATTLTGHCTSNNNILGAQVTWNIT